MALPEKDAFTVDEIAAHFDTTASTVANWIECGFMHACVRIRQPIRGEWRDERRGDMDSRRGHIDGLCRLSLRTVAEILAYAPGAVQVFHLHREPQHEIHVLESAYWICDLDQPQPFGVSDMLVARFERERFGAIWKAKRRAVLSPAQQRIEIIVEALAKDNPNLLALPIGVKAELGHRLCTEMPELFTKHLFQNAWSAGINDVPPRFGFAKKNWRTSGKG